MYFDRNGSVANANIHGANYFGVLVNADAHNATVDVKGSSIHDIGETPLNGAQHGVGVYYRAFFSFNVRGTISGNTFMNYQKGGIVANGRGTSVQIRNNIVAGQGPVDYIAQNGVQVGYGADAQVMGNTVTGNAYSGAGGASSGGILVVGGAGYGTCPDGNPCPYTTGTQVMNNVVVNNDVGLFLSNVAGDGSSAPTTQTNIKAVGNTISDNAVTNISGGTTTGYQAGISDVGNNDKIINNDISGLGYQPNVSLTCFTIQIDASTDFTNRPKVHANTIN